MYLSLEEKVFYIAVLFEICPRLSQRWYKKEVTLSRFSWKVYRLLNSDWLYTHTRHIMFFSSRRMFHAAATPSPVCILLSPYSWSCRDSPHFYNTNNDIIKQRSIVRMKGSISSSLWFRRLVFSFLCRTVNEHVLMFKFLTLFTLILSIFS